MVWQWGLTHVSSFHSWSSWISERREWPYACDAEAQSPAVCFGIQSLHHCMVGRGGGLLSERGALRERGPLQQQELVNHPAGRKREGNNKKGDRKEAWSTSLFKPLNCFSWRGAVYRSVYDQPPYTDSLPRTHPPPPLCFLVSSSSPAVAVWMSGWMKQVESDAVGWGLLWLPGWLVSLLIIPRPPSLCGCCSVLAVFVCYWERMCHLAPFFFTSHHVRCVTETQIISFSFQRFCMMAVLASADSRQCDVSLACSGTFYS